MKSRETRQTQAPDVVARTSLVTRVRPTVISSLYVAAVAVLAGVGFVGHSPWPILLAALVTAPASILALPAYYVVYGLLALVPGANPSVSSGSAGAGGDGSVPSVGAGPDAALSWFTTTTHVLGTATLAAAAVLNVFLVRVYILERDT